MSKTPHIASSTICLILTLFITFLYFGAGIAKFKVSVILSTKMSNSQFLEQLEVLYILQTLLVKYAAHRVDFHLFFRQSTQKLVHSHFSGCDFCFLLRDRFELAGKSVDDFVGVRIFEGLHHVSLLRFLLVTADDLRELFL